MYVVGQPYRYAVGLKNGFPVYEMTTVKEIHAEHLVLANDVRIAYDRVGRLDIDLRLAAPPAPAKPAALTQAVKHPSCDYYESWAFRRNSRAMW